MKVSKKSWHYKAIREIGWWPKKSLCLYFWQVPAALVSLVMVYSVMTAVIVGMAGMGIFILSQPVFLMFASVPLIEHLILGGLSSILWFAVFKSAHETFAYGSYDKVLFSLKEIDKKPKKPKKPNLLLEYLKAKKQKICPTIEFDYGEN